MWTKTKLNQTLKILLIHTAYAEKGGEDTVFSNEVELLSEVAEVDTLTFSNSGTALNILKKFILAPWNFEAASRLRHKINEFQPDIIHLHNWHFAASPAVIRTAKKMGVPIVMTLHNYRLLCPSANLYCNGEIFTESLKRGFPWKAVFKKVYRNSLLQTFWLALVVHFHNLLGTWKKVDQYLALTDFGKDLFIKSKLGLKTDQVSTKGNFVNDNGYTINYRSEHFLYVGRLTKDKGLDVLLEAFSKSGRALKIIGDGPLKNEVIAAAHSHPNIVYEGLQPHHTIITEMKKANALIFPSVWYEGMPMTILEAFSTATPVIASNLGAMKSLVTNNYNGLLFEAGNATALQNELFNWDTLPPDTKHNYSNNARRTFEMHFTPERNLNSILSIYKRTIDQTNLSNNCSNIKHLQTKSIKTQGI